MNEQLECNKQNVMQLYDLMFNRRAQHSELW